MSQSDDLKKLLKALDKKAHTSESLEPWQELLSRRQTVASSKSSQAAEVLQGFYGSWAASYGHDPLITYSGTSAKPVQPVPVISSESRLGRPGLPEINFVPYSYRTNREGSKGPSLLGHPISFSVVGPTLKDPNCIWQWAAVDNSAGIFGDTLTLDTDIFGNPGPASFLDCYGISSVPSQGLYMVVSAVGGDDGFYYTGGSRSAISERTEYAGLAKWEIFRVERITGSVVTLDPSKRLTTYFSFGMGVTNIIRGVMFVKPYSARLVALPGGNAPGSERTFVVISPERTANTDLYPSYNWGTSNWLSLPGSSSAYTGEFALPIPVPTQSENGDTLVEARLDNVSQLGPLSAGLTRLTQCDLPIGASWDTTDVGKLLHVTKVDYDESIDFLGGSPESILGWYEISAAGFNGLFGINDYVTVKRIPEVDPSTGERFYGPGPYTQTPSVSVNFTLHKPVSSLFYNYPLDLDAMDSCRLTNLIDPIWVERSSKRVGTSTPSDTALGLGWNRADKAIFDTTPDANPGSLLDLGFRMVLFPAKSSGGFVVPDYDKPIDSREVTIDPNITDESQYIDIDYSGGIVRLSHTPVSGGDLAPNGLFTTPNNLEGRVALWASFVPYSMEKGQLGSGIRVTGGDSIAASVGSSELVQHDAYSGKTFFNVATGCTVTEGGSIILTIQDTENLLPPTGIVRLIQDPGDPYKPGDGDYGYSYKSTTVFGAYGTVTTLEGVYSLPGSTALPIIFVSEGIATLRRQPEVEYAADTTYGAASRTSSFRFAYADLTSNPDGSVTVFPSATKGPAEELRGVFPLGTSSELGRVHLDIANQNWVIGSPPYAPEGENEIGLEIQRGKIFTSMKLDFGAGDWSFKPFLNRGLSVSPANVSDPDRSLRPNQYQLEVHDSLIAGLPSGFLDYVPETENSRGTLCVRIEGSTISTSDISEWGGGFGLAAGDRAVFNVKKFGDRSVRDYEAKELSVVDEGPSNPVHWVSYTAAGGDTVADLETGFNSSFNTTHNCEPAYNYNDTRLFLTDRQVSSLASKPYLESDPITGAQTIDENTRYAITVYSADPKKGRGNRWITLVIAPKETGSVSPPDANSMASWLNGALYSSSHTNYVGDLLDEAGFVGSNYPYSSPKDTWPWEERQFLWIGPSDPRHPTGANTVCLLCGGFGSDQSISTAVRPRNFFNIMIEFHQTQGVDSGDDLGEILGGDFVASGNTEVVRCGLFFGDDSYDDPEPPEVNRPWNSTSYQEVFALANQKMGLPENGLQSLGEVVGSFPITNINTGVSPNLIDFEIPQGGSHEYFRGPQRNSHWHVQDGFAEAQEWSHVPVTGPDGEVLSIDNLDAAEWTTYFPPYLGRWVYPSFEHQTIDLSVSTDAGLAHIWVGYGSHPHTERDFVSQLSGLTTTGYRSFLLYGTASVGVPQVGPQSFQRGDLVFGFDSAGLAGRETTWEGFILDESAPALSGFSTDQDKNITVMVNPRGYTSTEDHIYSRSVGLSNFGGTFTPASLGSSSIFSCSVVTNPSASTISAALRFLYEHQYGVTSYRDGGGLLLGPKTGSGLDGGSSSTAETGLSNAVVMAGGRINLLSLVGPTLPAGLAFSSPVLGSVNPSSENIRFANTYIESGVFSTSVSLSEAPLAALDSAGLYDAFPVDSVGRTRGHQIGGVAGLRISGDAQVWLTGLKRFNSSTPTALVRYSRFETQGPPADSAQTGPVSLIGDKHIPTGYAASASGDSNYHLLQQEATISIGLTRADWAAFRSAVVTPDWPTSFDQVYEDGTDANHLLMAGHARNGDIPIPVRFLEGMYLHLAAPQFVTDPYYSVNEGAWRIVGTPMITSCASWAVLYGNDSDLYPFTPYNEAIGDETLPGTDAGTVDPGYPAISPIVAYIQLRVERFSAVPVTGTNPSQSFAYELVENQEDGHNWAFYRDAAGDYPVYVAEVVEPGGSPTGSHRGLSGITLDPGPGSSGYGYFPMDLVSIFSGSRSYGVLWPLVGRGRLYGIHEVTDNKGTVKSVAYFCMDEPGLSGTSTTMHKAYARCTIFSSQRPEDRLDEFSQANTRGEFVLEKGGRASYVGHLPRLGPGILMDGGLGLLQASAIRVQPRSGKVDRIGALAVFGQGAAYPLSDYVSDRVNRGTRIASTFNETEFYEDTIIVGPTGRLIFENARAAQGLGYNLRENIAASAATLNPLQLAVLRTGSSAGADAQYYPNDSLFPFGTSGIRFKMPGTVVYERPYRSIETTGSSSVFSAWKGYVGTGGIRGLEVPTFGECLLLPKGPPNPVPSNLNGEANFRSANPRGNTPLDLPLYEFTNGFGWGTVNEAFPVVPAHVFSQQPVGGDINAGPTYHRTNPGSCIQGYRHSHSIEDGTIYGPNGVSESSFDLTEQLRLLDGMVLEDIDNGTFYTVGAVGHERDCWPTFPAGSRVYVSGNLDQPGLLGVNRTCVNGSITCASGTHQNCNITVSFPLTGGQGIQFLMEDATVYQVLYNTHFTGGTAQAAANSMATYINSASIPDLAAYCDGVNPIVYVAKRQVGSYYYAGTPPNLVQVQRTIAEYTLDPVSPVGVYVDLYGGDNPEIVYDIGPHTDKRAGINSTPQNGYGDRVDNGYVRRPLRGHKFRVTPNVEFVPVLGPRGVDGGLLPPRDSAGNLIPGADAIFYSLTSGGTSYSFKNPGDIGRFIYICGTREYAYTGWWIIVDVIPRYDVYNGNLAVDHDVAVLRKWNRGNELLRVAGQSPFPLFERAPILRCASDNRTNDCVNEYGYFQQTNPVGSLTMEVTNSSGVNIHTYTVPMAGLVNSCLSMANFGNADPGLNGMNVPLPGNHPGEFIRWTAETNAQYPQGVNVEVTYLLDGEGDQATVTLVVTAPPAPGDWVNINGTPLTGVAGPRTPGANDFSITGANAQVLRSIVEAINDPLNGFTGICTASIAAGSLFAVLTAVPPGVAGNVLTISVISTPPFVIGGPLFAGGTGTCKALTTEQRQVLLGQRGTLRIQFFSNLDSSRAQKEGMLYFHTSSDGDLAMGFYSFVGANQQCDRGSGDRNNAALLYSAGSGYTCYPTAKGLRWVFSSPLTEEHAGSYVHLQKPALYRYGIQLETATDPIPISNESWTSGWPRKPYSGSILDDDEDLLVDIFRVNRCPNTGHLVLGGDCEVYYPEIIEATNRKGRPILYSPLSVMGLWPDTTIGLLPDTGHRGTPIVYALQPIAREKILTVAPRLASSNVVRAHGGELAALSGQGFGVAPLVSTPDILGVTTSNLETITQDISKPWILVDRHSATRTSLAALRNNATNPAWPALLGQYGTLFNDSGEMFNSNNPTPTDKTNPLGISDYTWAPAGEWWQLYWPNGYIKRSFQWNASCQPPTLRYDLTDLFTQAAQAGSGINSPYPGKAPKGARLNRIWVNAGFWGNWFDGAATKDLLPGYVWDATVNKTLTSFYMAFNLVLEIPGSQRAGTTGSSQQPLGSGTGGLPFGDRAPYASYTHEDNSGDYGYPGGTLIIPLYMNREAGDMMPNVMERFVTAGPRPALGGGVEPDPTPDWVVGDYEYGFGCSSGSGLTIHSNIIGAYDLFGTNSLACNSHNPILWGCIDTDGSGFGPFTGGPASRVLGTPFPRTSRVSGGVRSAFTSGLVPDGSWFEQAFPHSLCGATLTGLVVAHGAQLPFPNEVSAGGFDGVTWDTVRTCGHSFTFALTPVGDFWEPPKDGAGNRIQVQYDTIIPEGDSKFPFYGRRLQNFNTFQAKSRPFKVGNWLDNILDRYGIAVPSGSMLPPGARVFLEITTGPGPETAPNFNHPEPSGAAGTWIGSIKCSFEVETADGTAYTMNVNRLEED